MSFGKTFLTMLGRVKNNTDEPKLIDVIATDTEKPQVEDESIDEEDDPIQDYEMLVSSARSYIDNELKEVLCLLRTWYAITTDIVINRYWISHKQLLASFMITIGESYAQKVCAKLTDEELQTTSSLIMTTEIVDIQSKYDILQKFCKDMASRKYISLGGIEYARNILEKTVGTEKTVSIIERIVSSVQVKPFSFIKRVEPGHLLNFLQQEHPQVIAVVISYLDPQKASIILQNLNPDIQGDVSKRIATMDKIAPTTLREIERVLEKKLSAISSEEYSSAGGIDSLVEILSYTKRKTEEYVVTYLEDEDPELAEEVKTRMFTFENLTSLDGRSIQKVLREVDSSELAKALKGSSAEVQEKIFENMSHRAVTMMKEDMEYMGPIRKVDMEECQQKIISIIRHLENIGEITIVRSAEDEMVV